MANPLQQAIAGSSAIISSDTEDWRSVQEKNRSIAEVTSLIKQKRLLEKDKKDQIVEERSATNHAYVRASTRIRDELAIFTDELQRSSTTPEKSKELYSDFINTLDNLEKTDERFQEPDVEVLLRGVRTTGKDRFEDHQDKRDFSDLQRQLDDAQIANWKSGKFENSPSTWENIRTPLENFQDIYIRQDDKDAITAVDNLNKILMKKQYVSQILDKYDIDDPTDDVDFIDIQFDENIGTRERELVLEAVRHAKLGNINKAFDLLSLERKERREDNKVIQDGVDARLKALNSENFQKQLSENKIAKETIKNINNLEVFMASSIGNAVSGGATTENNYNEDIDWENLEKDMVGIHAFFEHDSDLYEGEDGKKIAKMAAGLDDEGKRYFYAGLIRKVDNQFVWNIGLASDIQENLVPYTNKSGEKLINHSFGDVPGKINWDMVTKSRENLAGELDLKKVVNQFGAKDTDFGDTTAVTNMEFMNYVGNIIIRHIKHNKNSTERGRENLRAEWRKDESLDEGLTKSFGKIRGDLAVRDLISATSTISDKFDELSELRDQGEMEISEKEFEKKKEETSVKVQQVIDDYFDKNTKGKGLNFSKRRQKIIMSEFIRKKLMEEKDLEEGEK